jgi:hypothetical protein
MPGQFKYTAANTTSIKTANPNVAKAFCAGRAAQVAGTGSNPHTSGDELYTAWATTPEGLRDGCALAIPITVPDVVNLSRTAAVAAIVAAGFVDGKVVWNGPSQGVVYSQLPAAAAKAQPGDTVTLRLASTVPTLTGLTSAAAQAAITLAGLVTGTITGTTGVVTAQTPIGTSLVNPNSAVDFTIA